VTELAEASSDKFALYFIIARDVVNI